MAYENAQLDDKPVTDWLHDWDWLDPAWGEHAISIWNQIRDQCPIASTERYGRAFLPVTMESVQAIAQDTEHFSSWRVSVARPDAPPRAAPPITSDPPDHHGHRRLLLPSFNPKAIALMEQDLRDFCRNLISEIGDAPTADAAEQYSQHIPVHGICSMLGVPESDADMFRDWIYRNFQLAPKDLEERLRVIAEMVEYSSAALAERRREPKDDLLTLIAHAEIDGVPVSEELQVGYVQLMVLAGIDTTWSAIGSGLWHFAQHPDQRKRLCSVDNDDVLWVQAVEEVLRFYAPVTMARQVVGDTEVAGCPMHPGDQTLVTFPAANHDPAAFEHPEIFDIDRERNRHVAFGLGIHRCLGSNLARLELTVALQEWIRAFPDYALDPNGTTTWANGQVRGPRNIPVILN
ncbi:MAG: cytochrome P450 [Ilumatobacteraceae bacterium]